jgi:hypothetical protein
MSSFLLKAVGLNNFNVGGDAGNNLYYWATDLQDTHTPWVRLWVDWTQLAPTAPPEGQPINPAADTTRPAGGGWSPAEYVAYLDFQLRAAKQAELQVMLTFWLYPQWVNGSANVYTLPTDVSATSPWAQYLLWVMTRWNQFNDANGGGFADMLEVCNETDIASFDPAIHRQDATTTAQMLVTARQLMQVNGLTKPILAGPAHTDFDGYTTWIDWLIFELGQRGFSGDANFAWTLHNYGDVATVSAFRAQDVRNRLKAFWNGWPTGRAGEDTTFILATEGGSLARDRGVQRNTVESAYRLWSNDTDGKGLLMFTQFLNVSSPVFDSGMRNYAIDATGGAPLNRKFPKRPLWRTWSDL